MTTMKSPNPPERPTLSEHDLPGDNIVALPFVAVLGAILKRV